MTTGTPNDTRPSPTPRDPHKAPETGRHRYIRGETGAERHAPYLTRIHQPDADSVRRRATRGGVA